MEAVDCSEKCLRKFIWCLGGGTARSQDAAETIKYQPANHFESHVPATCIMQVRDFAVEFERSSTSPEKNMLPSVASRRLGSDALVSAHVRSAQARDVGASWASLQGESHLRMVSVNFVLMASLVLHMSHRPYAEASRLK